MLVNSEYFKEVNLLENNTYITSASMATTITSNPILIKDWNNFSLFVKWTGTPTGTLKLQACNDQYNPTDYEDITGSSYAIAGAAGQLMYTYDTAPFKWLRLVYTATSGTGTITKADFHAKVQT